MKARHNSEDDFSKNETRNCSETFALTAGMAFEYQAAQANERRAVSDLDLSPRSAHI